MQRIETRTQLVNFICRAIPLHAIGRAACVGTVQVMGGFSRVPPLPKPGWVVSFTSIHGRTWIVAVIPDEQHHIFKAHIIETIPWEYYIGRSDQEEYSIYNGDNPQQAYLARKKC